MLTFQSKHTRKIQCIFTGRKNTLYTYSSYYAQTHHPSHKNIIPQQSFLIHSLPFFPRTPILAQYIRAIRKTKLHLKTSTRYLSVTLEKLQSDMNTVVKGRESRKKLLKRNTTWFQNTLSTSGMKHELISMWKSGQNSQTLRKQTRTEASRSTLWSRAWRCPHLCLVTLKTLRFQPSELLAHNSQYSQQPTVMNNTNTEQFHTKGLEKRVTFKVWVKTGFS